MGLIKTAIMTGGGLYAVDKIAKASLNRHDNQVQQHTCQRCGYTNGSPQQSWGPPPRGGPQNDYQYGGYQDQRQFNPSSENQRQFNPSSENQRQPNFDDQRGFYPSTQQRAGISPADFDDGKRYVDSQFQQTSTPPPYNQQKENALR
ncbi:hypothetical protein L207DRAFT_507317 [Hyaloscypha variabilis F]|uniref:Uncharacterized protein n=1 Tax=Hyaloscypha variabilis (strain UAMH 11265 / GT02V1 / F) TaxID=1149755 RepID=A0A2J6S6K5_HYAVF|nr:hypothetical protein L207DRAFT_507317 [Hyaloscypha variabilis F]